MKKDDEIRNIHSVRSVMLGGLIRDKREAFALSQRRLAKILNVSGQYLGKIEKGEISISKELLVKSISILSIDRSTLEELLLYVVQEEALEIFKLSQEVSI